MALTASITLNQSSGSIHTPITAIVTVSNSSGAPVNVLTILPQIVATNDSEPQDASSFNTSPAFITSQNTSVPASGSTVYQFTTVFHKPSATTYNIGCMVCGSDGSVVFATPATVTITSIP